jgi:hypothetical protein
MFIGAITRVGITLYVILVGNVLITKYLAFISSHD